MSRHNQRNVAGASARRHSLSASAHRHAGDVHRPAPADSLLPASSGRTGPSTVTIGQFFGTLRRRFVLVTVCLLLGIAAGLGMFVHTPKTYQATAVVDISPILGNQNGNANANSVSTITESKIATSASVALIAAHTIGYVGTFDGLVQQVTVSSPLASQVLNITFSSSRPQGAADGANAFANAYLAYRTSTGEDQLKLRIARITDQVNQLQAGLAKLKVPSDGPSDPQYVSQQSLLQNQLQQLQSQLNTYRTSVITPGQVAGAASTPSAPSSPKLVLYVAGGLLVGLLAGAVLAVLRDRRDDRVRSAAELADRLAAPVIAEVSTGRQSKGAPQLVALSAAHSPEADAYRSVTTTVTADSADSRVVLVAGAGREGHSLTPLNLAVTFALQGLTTVIAGPSAALAPAEALLDLQAPSRPDAPRLSDRLARSHAVPELSVLSLGSEVSLSATLRSNGDNLHDVLARADIVVLDGFNTELPSTTMRLGQIADEAVIVSFRDQTTHADLGRLAHQLAQVHSTVLGAMLLNRRTGVFSRLPGLRRRRDAKEPVVARAKATTAPNPAHTSAGRGSATSAAAGPDTAAERSSHDDTMADVDQSPNRQSGSERGVTTSDASPAKDQSSNQAHAAGRGVNQRSNEGKSPESLTIFSTATRRR